METHPSISHSVLIRPMVYNSGLLYPKGISTLEVELENRKRAHNAFTYSEEEIKNTFYPLLECLSFLHGKGIVHGCVSPHNVIITEDEEIKMKDWLVENKENAYYFNKKRKEIVKEDDYIAMGQIMAQAATLRKGNKIFLDR